MRPQFSGALAAGAVALATSMAVGVPDALGASETVLYSFQGWPSDGANPNGGLLYYGGKLYGTTSAGGGGGQCLNSFIGCGTVFSYSLGGAETMLHSFGTPYSDPTVPNPDLIVAGGALYGTAATGGVVCPQHYGCGGVFKVTLAGEESVLYSFRWFTDGAEAVATPKSRDAAYPQAGIVKLGGALYGAARGGTGSDLPGCSGAYGCGAIFKVTLNGEETLPYSFTSGAAGAYPSTGLTELNGLFYGSTYTGAATGGGIIYSMTKTGERKTVYSFPHGYDEAMPSRLITVKGALFGITPTGGAYGLGTVFTVTPAGHYTLLHSFSGGSDGAMPTSLVYTGGALYGTTHGGGAQNAGTVFRISRSGAETVVYAFLGGSDGSEPTGVIDVQGTLYGTTTLGGAANFGTVFKLAP